MLSRETLLLVVLLPLVAALTAYFHLQDRWNTADPLSVLKEAHRLAEGGEPAKALRRYQWVHRWSRRDDLVEGADAGFIHTYSIESWADLAKTYPPARESLLIIRDRNEAHLRQGDDSVDLIYEVLVINEGLGEEQRTAQLFHEFRKTRPQFVARHFAIARHQLVKVREYQLCSSQIPDAVADLRLWIKYRETYFQLADDAATEKERQSLLQTADEYLARQAGQLVEILVGAGRTAEAEEVRRQTLAAKDTPAVRQALEDAVRRATQSR
jgi:hypothetical protein